MEEGGGKDDYVLSEYNKFSNEGNNRRCLRVKRRVLQGGRFYDFVLKYLAGSQSKLILQYQQNTSETMGF